MTSEENNLIEPEHIGDGFYMLDRGYAVEVAVNHHMNVVGSIDMNDIDRAISYLQKVKNRIENR